MIGLSLVAVVYIGFVALVQEDMKKLIAYSSIAHMGFVTLGFFIAWAIYSGTGATERHRRIGHHRRHGADDLPRVHLRRTCSLCVGVMYDRMHSRQICGLRRRR